MYISTEIASFKKYGSNEKILKLLKDSGFEAYDFSMFFSTEESFMFCDDYIEKATRLRAYADSIGIVCNQSHAPFPTLRPISAWGDAIQAEMERGMVRENGKIFPKNVDDICYFNETLVTLMKRCIEITGILGGKAIVIHPSSSVTTEQNVAFYKQFQEVADKNDVKIALENMWVWNKEKDCAGYAACCNAQSFMEHLNLLDKDAFVACVDIGHAEMMGEITDSRALLQGVKHRLFCLHIHDNDLYKDRHMIPLVGSIDFEKVIDTLAEIGYNGDLTMEADTYMRHFDVEFFPIAARYMYEIGNYLRKKLNDKIQQKRQCVESNRTQGDELSI